MKNLKLSIIIPVYNAERYITQALDSLCYQITDDIEIIIIDDGSTDASGIICDRYSQRDSRIKIEHTLNHGVSNARNRGLKLAQGELITFVDSDDWVEQDYCSTIIREMQDVDILIFNPIVHRTSQVEVTSFTHNGKYVTEEDVADVLSEIHYPMNRLGWPWNKAFRKDIIEKVHANFPEDISLFEDEVFMLQYCTKVKALRIISQPLYNYRVTGNSLSCRNIDPEEYIKIADYIDQMAERYKYERFLSGLYWQVMWLKLAAYKRQKHRTYSQFKSINRYYKSRVPIIKLCPAKALHVIFGHCDWHSYCLYVCIRLIGKI